jgi:hypothetical protein
MKIIKSSLLRKFTLDLHHLTFYKVLGFKVATRQLPDEKSQAIKISPFSSTQGGRMYRQASIPWASPLLYLKIKK